MRTFLTLLAYFLLLMGMGDIVIAIWAPCFVHIAIELRINGAVVGCAEFLAVIAICQVLKIK